jgi:hypothetical protein
MTSSDLHNIASNTTSIAIALLSLLAIAVLIYGFARAIVMNRRIQVVVTDLMTPAGSEELAGSTKLSPILRQYVKRDTQDQKERVAGVGKSILLSASPDLEPQLHEGAVENIQQTADDSIAAVSAALQAVTPENANRFLGLFSVLLPPPRGLRVTVTLLERGNNMTPRLGAAVDVGRLDGKSIASTTFWEGTLTADQSDTRQLAHTERILALLEPVSMWIAVRLVVSLLVSPRYRTTSSKSKGLRRLLAGGLFLAAMREFPTHALAFGDQACAELEQASAQMPGILLPLTTLAGVHERMGWARRADGQPQQASKDFGTAVRLWKKAQDLTLNDSAKLAELKDRRLKAQLASDQPRLRASALAELAELDLPSAPSPQKDNRVWLYNRSCLYAQASRADPGGGNQQKALRWLGLALIGDLESNLWEYAANEDPELAAIREIVKTFLANLQNLIPEYAAQVNDMDAEIIIANAITVTSIDGRRRRRARWLHRQDSASKALREMFGRPSARMNKGARVVGGPATPGSTP